MNAEVITNQNTANNITNDENAITSIYLEQIGGSNNSQIFELFGQTQTQAAQIYPKKGTSLKKVLKTINHACSDPSNPTLKSHSRECQHLFTEARLLSQLDHPNIIKLLEYIKDNQDYCGIVLPKADCDLYQLLGQSHAQGQQLEYNLIRSYFKQLLSALSYMHSNGVAHNDIKLANLFINKSEEKLLLADLGFAQIQQNSAADEQFTRWDSRCLNHMSPELVQKTQTNDKTTLVNEYASDMFALGVTLFEVVFQMSPFKGEFASENDEIFAPLYLDKSQVMKFWSNEQILKKIMLLKGQPQFSSLLDLITRCFSVDPAQRITAEQAKNHPWFQNI